MSAFVAWLREHPFMALSIALAFALIGTWVERAITMGRHLPPSEASIEGYRQQVDVHQQEVAGRLRTIEAALRRILHKLGIG